VSLSSTEQTLEAILQTFTDANFLLTPDGVILDYKPGNTPLSLAFSGSLQNKKIKDIFPSPTVTKLEDALRTVERTGNVVPLEYELPLSNLEYCVDARLIPVSDSQIMLIARVITECR